MSNMFYESGLFQNVDPGFVYELSVNCLTDNEFDAQWGMRDIRACYAWMITKGDPSVSVAIVDQGVDKLHKEFENVNISFSFDVIDSTSPAVLYGEHGTHCAGIVFANHNQYDIAGVAPRASLVDISHPLSGTFEEFVKDMAVAINYGAYNNVDILSNSWGFKRSESVNLVNSPLLESAIRNAIVNGRGGLGSVVVFAAGNTRSYYDPYFDVAYPACCNDSILVVGALDQYGIRGSFSKYGEELDVVAPGVDVYSCLPYNRYASWDGTSMACPHVAGVAALILSVAPSLTSKQVRDIIETTAQKVRTDVYTYSAGQDHPNGTWNDEMGYGLVDAYAAVRMALGSDLYVRDVLSDNGSTPSQATYMWCSPDIWIEDLSGNVVEYPRGDSDYKVCVRIHNRKGTASNGHEKLLLNWVKAGIGTQWPVDWTGETMFDCMGAQVPKGGFVDSPDGTVIPVIPAWGNRVVKVPWHTPRAEDYATCSDFGDELWHFCLLARVHDSEEIQGEDVLGYDMGQLTVQNNNVAWKNITLLNSRYNRAVISIANPTLKEQKFKIFFIAHPNDKGEYINDFADVYWQLDQTLMELWQEYGGMNENVEVLEENTLLMTHYRASLDGIMIPLDKHYTLAAQVNFYAKRIPQNDTLCFDIVLCDERGNFVGGERYRAVREEGRTFSAVAYEDQTVVMGDEIRLVAANIGEPATYKWYDGHGEKLGEGMELRTTPQQSQFYTLEVTAESDGYKDYDQVDVRVTAGEIVKINPNPADHMVTVACRLPEEMPLCKLEIVTQMGLVVLSEPVLSGLSQKTMDIQHLTVGHYIVKLLTSEGIVLDAKTLIVQ
ncbi:MAG: S8 family serine peptidase [Bacteroidales bacterium]|nr:S8 family serine peptidase [Bacteroidales bacterium]